MAQLVVPPGTFGQNSDVQVNEPLASRSHRNWQAVHIDAGHSFTSTRVNGLVVQLVNIENCTLSARKNAPSQGGRGQKEKALISQDFFGLVVATGLEPVTPSM